MQPDDSPFCLTSVTAQRQNFDDIHTAISESNGSGASRRLPTRVCRCAVACPAPCLQRLTYGRDLSLSGWCRGIRQLTHCPPPARPPYRSAPLSPLAWRMANADGHCLLCLGDLADLHGRRIGRFFTVQSVCRMLVASKVSDLRYTVVVFFRPIRQGQWRCPSRRCGNHRRFDGTRAFLFFFFFWLRSSRCVLSYRAIVIPGTNCVGEKNFADETRCRSLGDRGNYPNTTHT